VAITDLDEQLLVRAHQAGDEHAFGQIVRSQHRALYAHAYRRLGNHEAAEDAVQDTLLRAYRALPSFDGDLRLRAWLHRILTNVCHDESNRRKRASGLIDKLEAQPVELAPDPIEETVLHDTVRVMNEALAELPDSYREALVLRYVDGLSFREVAAATGVSEENARARVHRGRIALNKALSRVTVMLAFLIPGLRGRAEKALDADALSSVSSAEPAISLSTRLATHVSTSAPVLERVANEGSTLLAAKTSVVATAVAAVAAVAAPVAAYKVYDTAQRPTPPPAAVAAPADAPPTEAPDEVAAAASSEVPRAPVVDGAPLVPGSSTTSSSATSTPSTLPQSAVAPFVGTPADDRDESKPTTTTTSTPPASPSGTAAAHIGGEAFTVEGARPDFSVTGQVVVQSGEDTESGSLAGDVYIADAVGGDASAELDLVLGDATELRLRFRGVLSSEVTDGGATTWVLYGDYRAIGGERLGVAELGTATITFRYVDGAPSALDLDLHGQQQSE
jgi:RNA polymerase sigma-70 factor (ECF subfamily)